MPKKRPGRIRDPARHITLAPTSTRQVVTLPPGVTEADRLAAEAAAIGWWEEFYLQLDLLPDFKPDAFLRRAVAGRPAGPAMVSEFTKFQSKGFVVRKGNVRRVVILSTRFVSPAKAEVEVCAADDGAFINKSTGATESEGLVRTFFLNVLEKTDDGWTIADYGSSRASEEGKTCD